MNTWPIDDRNLGKNASNRKGKAKQIFSAPNYPDLHIGSNAATLVEKNGALEWSFLARNETQGRKLHIGKCKTIFPPSRSTPEHLIKRTVLQSIKRGSEFLRTLHPDVDIPAEVIRKELVQDMQINQKLKVFDPYKGNLLEPIVTSNGTALAFSMGELNRELNLSLFSQSQGYTTFEPSARPAYTFGTPIQQIAASPPLMNGLHVPYLAVRSFGITSILAVTLSGELSTLNEVTAISHADTGGRALVDISLPMAPMEVLVVNDIGSLYHFSALDGQKYMRMIRPPSEDVSDSDSFWRLSRGANNTCLVASKDTLTQFDLRTNIAQKLFLLPEPREVFTGIEDQDSHHIVKLCSTREILWVDVRFPGKPLLGYRHGRQHDRALQICTSPTFPMLTLLSSWNNAMMTVYDVTRSDTQLFHVNSPPYCFFPGHNASVSHHGQAIIRNPHDLGSFGLIRLDERGSLCYIDLSWSGARPPVFETPRKIEQLKDGSPAGSEIPYNDQAFIEFDFSSAMEGMFTAYLDGGEEKDVEANEYNFEAIPTIWQEAEPPVQHISTTFDVVFRAGCEPDQLSRSDFLTESNINSRSGYWAMAQGRLTPEVVARGAAWHNNLDATLQHLGLRLSGDVQDLADTLSRYDLVEDPKRSAQSVKWEREAREQLALDLVLSSNIYSSHPIVDPSQRKLEDMTRSLSLGGEPPVVDFGFLRPVSSKNDAGEGDLGEFRTSTGVRSLLKEWSIGTDVGGYELVDKHAVTTRLAPRPEVDRENHSELESQPKKPPKIMAPSVAFSQPVGAEQKNLMSHSQECRLDMGVSQETMANTQILPGAYGGRHRRKAAKKRVGGF